LLVYITFSILEAATRATAKIKKESIFQITSV